jgi:midasin
MKKVIPYIASDFKKVTMINYHSTAQFQVKDKIWLRRTQPSKRQYQVMLAIDDSESMMINHSAQMAYEALTTIANALSHLEVGQLSIMGFGEDVKLLHPFDVPFTSGSGGNVWTY